MNLSNCILFKLKSILMLNFNKDWYSGLYSNRFLPSGFWIHKPLFPFWFMKILNEHKGVPI